MSSLKERVINLALWTGIFIGVSYFLNPLVFKESSSEFLVIAYCILGILFLFGIFGSWIGIVKEIARQRKKD